MFLNPSGMQNENQRDGRIGKCKLCLETKELRDSHLLPRSLYKTLRTTEVPNPNPIFLTSTRAGQTSKQLTDYVLCGHCEGLFNANGESWMMRQAAQSGSFPLREAVKAAPSLFADATFSVHSCADIYRIDLNKILYFALSVFWRASVHTWRVQDREVRINLGPYTEPIRRFLRRTGGFPHNTFLVVTVMPAPESAFVLIPPVRLLPRDFHLFVFYIPGVQFLLCTGSRVPDHFKDACIQHSPKHLIWFHEDMTGTVAEKVLSNSKHSLILKRFLSGRGPKNSTSGAARS
jgi:hypothetical protein